MTINIVAGETYWVCYEGTEAYGIIPQHVVSTFDDDKAWACSTPRGRANIWASKMHLTKKKAIDENIKRYDS